MQRFKFLAHTELTAVNWVQFCFFFCLFVFPLLSRISVHKGNWIVYRKLKGNIFFFCMTDHSGCIFNICTHTYDLVLNLHCHKFQMHRQSSYAEQSSLQLSIQYTAYHATLDQGDFIHGPFSMGWSVPPPNPCLLGSSECDLIWKESLWRCNQLKRGHKLD